MAAPVIYDITPNSGPAIGGGYVTVTGRYLTGASAATCLRCRSIFCVR